jgi:hypothetical protein
VVEAHLVDGADRGIGVGIGSEQHALGFGKEHQRLSEELDPGHLRHALVDDEAGDNPVRQLELLERFERFSTRCGTPDVVVARVLAAEVARHRGKHTGVVVDGEDDRLFQG